jgi:hypothetical protein
MNEYERTFIASSETFSGFRVNIPLTNVETIDDIITIFKNELHMVLKKNNFDLLLEKLEISNFHIHEFTIEDILTSKHEDIFYICDHK